MSAFRAIHHSASSICPILSPLASSQVFLAECHASDGRFEAANSFFSFLSSVYPVGTPLSVTWLRAKHRVDFVRAVGEAALEDAAAAQSSLAALDATEGALLSALLLSERSLYAAAVDRLLALLALLDGQSTSGVSSSLSSSPSSSAQLRENRHHLRAAVLLALGEVFCQMGNAPQAIQYLLKALTFSEARHHDMRATEAKVLLALTQYLLHMPSQVRMRGRSVVWSVGVGGVFCRVCG